jgi:hypothetical protein
MLGGLHLLNVGALLGALDLVVSRGVMGRAGQSVRGLPLEPPLNSNSEQRLLRLEEAIVWAGSSRRRAKGEGRENASNATRQGRWGRGSRVSGAGWECGW